MVDFDAAKVSSQNLSDEICEPAMEYYKSARAELTQRLVLRDGSLLFYIASIGSYLSFIINQHFPADKTNDISIEKAIALCIPLPFICLIFSLLVLQHHMAIGNIGAYIRFELSPYLVDNQKIRNWDNSATLRLQGSGLLNLRLYSQSSILVLPIFYTLFFVWEFFWFAYYDSVESLVAILFLGLVDVLIVITVVFLHIDVHRKRITEFNYRVSK